MPFESNLLKKMNKMTLLIPISFAFLCLLFVSGVVLLKLKGVANLETYYAFSIGTDLLGMAIAIMLCFGTLSNRKEPTAYTKIFVLLISLTSMAMFVDECSWLVDAIPSLAKVNLVVNVIYFANSAILTFFFWKYVTYALDLEGKFMSTLDLIMKILIVPNVLSAPINLFYPLYFSVSELGKYERTGETYWISQIYSAIGIIFVILALIFSKAPTRTKIVTASFIFIPVLNQIITLYSYGLSTQYAAMLVSIVLIFVVIYSDREKKLASSGKELALATRIQASMLPNIYPAFPDREEFDIYATMEPAKEVGGDFYDFYLVDDSHLAVVIADVSGKGVPAALFMMVSKILIKNVALQMKSPSEILRIVNNQICEKNREEMFVTVWLGILDLNTGKMTCANAGHEYPILKQPSGNFEIIHDKHGFVVGGMEGAKYKDYEIIMTPDSKLYIYTDGVAEATNKDDVQFGISRMVDSLNNSKDKSTQEILKDMDISIKDFVGEAPQFDDITMLCLHYKGKQTKEE